MTIKEEILEAFKNVEFGQIFTTSEIIEKVRLISGRNSSSIIPSDYCYNRINNGIDFENATHLFEYTADRKYKYLGANYTYSGKIYHKQKGRSEICIGEMVHGTVLQKSPVEKHDSNEITGTHVTKRDMSREIIINKMYVGAYLSKGDNIGHEIINLYKADDGKNYIYLNSQGTIELSHGKNRITVLLVRKFASKTFKVLAKVEGVTILDFANSKLSREERYKGQVTLGLTYGGISLVDIFNKNSYHDSLQEEKNAYTTFVADKVIKPKNQIYITDDSSASGDNIFFIRTIKGFGKQTLREFYNENEKPDSFTDLNRIIENRELWEDANTTQEISKLPELQKDPYFNFLKIIRQEDNELAFSNMFAHFFNIKREAFSRFASDVLHIEIQTDFTIEREKKNIDLLISDEKNAVVIENKIKSNINGIDDRHNIYSDQVQSQLQRYYQFVTSDDEYRKKTASCFIFSPNYNRIELSRFSCGEKYTIVYYREIYNFFVENRGLFEGVPYFDDFINAMNKHTKDYDNDLEEEMQRRFQNAICKAKKR